MYTIHVQFQINNIEPRGKWKYNKKTIVGSYNKDNTKTCNQLLLIKVLKETTTK